MDLANVMSGEGSVSVGTVSEGDYAVGSRTEGETDEAEVEDEPEAAESPPPDKEKQVSRTIPIQKLKKILERQKSDD